MPNETEPGIAAAFSTVTLIGLHNGAAGASTSFMLQGNAVSVPAAYPAGFNLQFPSPKATTLRARAWVNTLAQPLTVTLMKNGSPVLNASGVAVALTIPAGSTAVVRNDADVTDYSPSDTYEIRLTSNAGGGGNSAIVAVCIEAARTDVLPGRSAVFNTVTLTGLHNGSAGSSTPWMQQGDATTPPGSFASTFRFPFPAPKAVALRARAFTNNLATDLTVELRRRSPAQAAANTSSIVATVVIPAGSTAPVLNSTNVTSYSTTEKDATGALVSDGSYDVRLTSTGAGAGNSAQVAACIDAVE